MNAEVEMPRWQCHKIVHALQVETILLDAVDGLERHRVTFVDKRYAPLMITEDMFQKHKPGVGWYFVVYPDGYMSFSPAQSFEAGYTLITP
jgi:hypothetical protein